LMTRPNVLIADEPTASLDKESSIKLFDVLNFYNVKRKLTVIWASHNRDLVKQFPGKIVHLENGKLVYSGHACFI
jgi:ABC-type phosphate/phosphonate transport system, ATPase component